jgi:hypothetical protein
MRAGRWLNNRDRTAAWASWQRAREVADALPAADPDRAARQIAALTRLCGEVWKTGGDLGDAGFSQLRELCRATGDHHSLAIGMGGMVMGLTGQHRHDEAAGLTSELLTLLESLHDPAVVCNLLLSVTYAKSEIGEVRQALELAQRVIDMADHDLAKSGVLFGSPLASATRMRGLYRLSLGIPGWREDGHAAVLMSRGMDPTSQVSAVMYKYILSVPVRARTVDDAALRETAAALRIAEQAGDYLTLTLAQTARGLVLLHSDKPTQEGADVLEEARRTSVARGFTMNAMALIDPVLARHEALRGDLDASIRLARDAIATMAERREALSMGVATSVLVESLLRRRAHGDMSEAVAALDHLAGLPTDEGFVLYEWPMMRLRGLVARACGDDASAEGHLQRYRALARSADFDAPTGDFMS